MPVIACTGSFLSAAWTLVSSSADDFGLLTCLTRGVPLDPAHRSAPYRQRSSQRRASRKTELTRRTLPRLGLQPGQLLLRAPSDWSARSVNVEPCPAQRVSSEARVAAGAAETDHAGRELAPRRAPGRFLSCSGRLCAQHGTDFAPAATVLPPLSRLRPATHARCLTRGENAGGSRRKPSLPLRRRESSRLSLPLLQQSPALLTLDELALSTPSQSNWRERRTRSSGRDFRPSSTSLAALRRTSSHRCTARIGSTVGRTRRDGSSTR